MSDQINLMSNKYVRLDAGFRDAIHVPILVAESDEELAPGTHVGLVDGSHTKVTAKSDRKIGIVNPFTEYNATPGLRFYVCIYPGIVTSLSHQWSHPYFEVGSAKESKAYIEMIAQKCSCSYDMLMDAAMGMSDYGDYFHMGQNEDYKDVSVSEWETFWKHFANMTGKITDEIYAPFSCSC